MLQQFQPAFLRTLSKNGNKHEFCEIILGKTVLALAQRQLSFFSTRLHIILHEFLLEFTITIVLHILSCSIALLTRQIKSTVNVQSNLSGSDAGSAGGARPRQLPCAD